MPSASENCRPKKLKPHSSRYEKVNLERDSGPWQETASVVPTNAAATGIARVGASGFPAMHSLLETGCSLEPQEQV